MNFKDILLMHTEKYPKMSPCDAVKLIYQATFGGGHMIKSEQTARDRIHAEYAACAADLHVGGEPVVESLGDTCRVYLNCELTEARLDAVARLFCLSAKSFCVGFDKADEMTKARFYERIRILRDMCADGHFGFDTAELDAYLAEYKDAGCPAVSHSEGYRHEYAPSYRVIDAKYAPYMGVIMHLADMLAEDRRVVLAIDGRCASGKTTAATLIAELFGGEIIHMDDFFLPPELRTEERLSEVGGNLHRERFKEEVLPHLRGEGTFSYRVFDCSRFDYKAEPRLVTPKRLMICEGSYALHPDFGKYYDLAVFSDVAPDEQLRRIAARDGEYMLTRFKNEWIPMEERYIDGFDIRKRCDILM